MDTQMLKLKEAAWERRTNRIKGFGYDCIPRVDPKARKHWEHEPYRSTGECMACLQEGRKTDEQE